MPRTTRSAPSPMPPIATSSTSASSDLIDDYKPDLLYFDDSTLPLNGSDPAYGLNIAAHYYNASTEWHGGNEAVMTTKGLKEAERKALVWDIERGKSDRLEPYPWQTDTCIGGWHYNRGIYEHHGYKTPATVIQMLVDIVSKNGNLLLNVPVRGDGTIDEDEVKCLEGIAQWTAINGEAIFGTRPWKTYGEGTREAKAGNFNEGKGLPYTAADLRFTTKGDTLYVFALAWPADGKLVVKSLGVKETGIRGDVTGVELLGAGKVAFQRGADRAGRDPAEEAALRNGLGLEDHGSRPGRLAARPFRRRGALLRAAGQERQPATAARGRHGPRQATPRPRARRQRDSEPMGQASGLGLLGD